nr:MAG TPA: hypothetical protein [Caudoviricetes sp.]
MSVEIPKPERKTAKWVYCRKQTKMAMNTAITNVLAAKCLQFKTDFIIGAHFAAHI